MKELGAISIVLIALSLLSSPSFSLTSFAAHQFDLWRGNSVPMNGTGGAIYTATATLPVAHNSQKRYLALSGLSLGCKNSINFELYLEPYSTISPTQGITLRPSIFPNFYTLKVYLLFAMAVSDYLWIYNGTLSTTDIATYATGPPDPSKPLVHTLPTTAPANSSIVDPTKYKAIFYLSCYSADTRNSEPIQVSVVIDSIVAPNLVYVSVWRSSLDQRITGLGYTIILLKEPSLKLTNIPYFIGGFQTYANWNSFGVNLLQSTPTNFGLQNIHLNLLSGTFDGNCIIGFSKMVIAGNSSAYYDRRVFFNATTFPISEKINNLHMIGAVIEDYYTLFNIFCLNQDRCATSTFWNPSTSLCSPCSITNCVACATYQICSVCATYTGWNNVTLSCDACWLMIPNCMTCINDTYCTACLDNTNFVGFNNLCVPCFYLVGNCHRCSVNLTVWNLTCYECFDGYFISSFSLLCEQCSLYLQQCQKCDNQTTCTECVNNSYFVSQSTGRCLLCNTRFLDCLQCTNNECLLCDHGFMLTSGQCYCQLGERVNGVCVINGGCVTQVLFPDGTLNCLQCDSMYYYPQPNNGVCQCLQGKFYAGGMCTSIQGCLTPLPNNDGSTYCAYCDVSLNFKGTPNSAGECQCTDHFTLINTQCSQICGDGYLMVQSSMNCDDGNTQNGDGCSSLCTVQSQYRCQNGSSSSPSACVYVGQPLTVSLQSITRTQGQNQGVFTFSFYPPLWSIQKMDLRKYVLFECQSTYIISSLQYTSGNLKVTADYSEDMENRQCTLQVSYNSAIIISPNSTFNFTAISNDEPLTLSSKLSMFGNLTFLFLYLGYAALCVFVVSLVHKMIGAELLVCCQLVYLSLCFFKKPSFLMSSIKSFSLVTGYWSLFHQQQDKNLIPSFTNRVYLSPYFSESSLFVTSVLFFSLLVCSILWIVKQLSLKYQNDQMPSWMKRISSALSLIYKAFLFPIQAAFFLVLSLAAFVNNLRFSNKRAQYFSTEVNSLSLLISELIFGIICLTELFPESYTGLNTEKNMKKWYIPIFLAKQIIFLFFFQIGMLSSLNNYIFLFISLQLVYFGLLLLFQPYQRIFDMIGVLICQFTTIYSLLLALLQRFFTPNEDIEVLLILVLEGLLMLTMLQSVIRIIILLKQAYLNNCKLNSISEEQQTHETIKNIQKQDKFGQNQMAQQIKAMMLVSNKQGSLKLRNSSVLSVLKMKQNHHTEQDEQLIKIKDRLRENLLREKIKKNNIIEQI